MLISLEESACDEDIIKTVKRTVTKMYGFRQDVFDEWIGNIQPVRGAGGVNSTNCRYKFDDNRMINCDTRSMQSSFPFIVLADAKCTGDNETTIEAVWGTMVSSAGTEDVLRGVNSLMFDTEHKPNEKMYLERVQGAGIAQYIATAAAMMFESYDPRDQRFTVNDWVMTTARNYKDVGAATVKFPTLTSLSNYVMSFMGKHTLITSTGESTTSTKSHKKKKPLCHFAPDDGLGGFPRV